MMLNQENPLVASVAAGMLMKMSLAYLVLTVGTQKKLQTKLIQRHVQTAIPKQVFFYTAGCAQ